MYKFKKKKDKKEIKGKRASISQWPRSEFDFDSLALNFVHNRETVSERIIYTMAVSLPLINTLISVNEFI